MDSAAGVAEWSLALASEAHLFPIQIEGYELSCYFRDNFSKANHFQTPPSSENVLSFLFVPV